MIPQVSGSAMRVRTGAMALGGAMLLAACGGGGGSVASTPTPVITTTTPSTPAATTPVVVTPPVVTPAVNYDTTEYRRSTGPVAMNALTAYNRGATGAGITIAITDSGVDVDNSEFAGRIAAASQDLVSGRSIDDESGHGTSVAAVALAAKNDSNIHGVAFAATLLALRTDTPGSCSGTDGCSHSDNVLARAIDLAVANGARIVNMSLGGSAANLTLRSAIGRATRAGIIFVISAGNDGAADPDALALVANDNLTANGLVLIAGSVGTASSATDISTFSNKAGSGASHYVATTGYRVRSIDQSNVNFLFSGTSYSAPHVAGALALILQAFPTLTSAQAIALLFSSADDAGAVGLDTVYGQGIVNLTKAFSPIGSTSLAGSVVAVSSSDNGVLGGALGDGGQLGASLGGAVILDGFGRAFAADLANTIAATPVPRLLASRLGDRTRAARLSGDNRVLSFTITPPTSTRPWVGLAQTGRDAHADDGIRVAHGLAASRIDAVTLGGFAFGYAPETLAATLDGRDQPAFLTSGPLGDSGLSQRSGLAAAVLRQVGPWQLGMTAGSARAIDPRPLTFGRRPEGRLDSVGMTAARQFGPVKLTAGLSQLAESDTLLGSQARGALGITGATTRFADIEARADLGRWSLSAGAKQGWTAARLGAGLVADTGTFRSIAWSAELSRHGLLGGDRLALRVAQPLRVERGIATLNVPVDYDYATLGTSFEARRVNLAPTGREIDIEAAYGIGLLGGTLDANLYLRRDPGHIASRTNDIGTALRFAVDF